MRGVVVVGRSVPVPFRRFLMAVDVGVIGTQGSFLVRHRGAAVCLFGIQVSLSRAVVCSRGLRQRPIGVLTCLVHTVHRHRLPTGESVAARLELRYPSACSRSA